MGNIRFSNWNWARYEKELKDNKHDSLHLWRKYERIFLLGHYLFLETHSSRSRKTVRFSEQIMSADKYPSIFSRQMEAIVCLAYTKTVDSVEGALWLAGQTPNILCYLPPSNSGKMAARFASVTSEEIIQIKFLWCILSHCFSIY